MGMAILYISVSIIYILLACLDGEDVKPKWKKWLAAKLDIKSKIEVKYIKPQAFKFHSRVVVSQFEMQYFCYDKYSMELLRNRVIESVCDGIVKKMMENDFITISQYKAIDTNDTIYEGTCEIYKISSV